MLSHTPLKVPCWAGRPLLKWKRTLGKSLRNFGPLVLALHTPQPPSRSQQTCFSLLSLVPVAATAQQHLAPRSKRPPGPRAPGPLDPLLLPPGQRRPYLRQVSAPPAPAAEAGGPNGCSAQSALSADPDSSGDRPTTLLLDLQPELFRRVASFVNRDEVADNLRLTCKAAAQHLAGFTTIRAALRALCRPTRWYGSGASQRPSGA